jgi:hypothetical protein
MCKIDNEIFNIIRARIRILEPTKAIIPFEDASMDLFTVLVLQSSPLKMKGALLAKLRYFILTIIFLKTVCCQFCFITTMLLIKLCIIACIGRYVMKAFVGQQQHC